MNVLGIETSCDETSAAIVTDGQEIRANIIASQADLHARYGGVVPEVASRKHVERMLPVAQDALDAARMTYRDLNAIAVTNRPGLLGALLVGVSYAKSLAYALDLPVVAVHHLEGHVYSNFLAAPDLVDAFPLLILIVSGGHTQIVRMDGHGQYALLGRTRDDAAGEAFDKSARLLGLPYPGGPNVARVGRTGRSDPRRLSPRTAGRQSGLQLQRPENVHSYLHDQRQRGDPAARCRGQSAGRRRRCACRKDAPRRTSDRHSDALFAGGVAANRNSTASMQTMAHANGYRLVVPDPILCTDNAAMIAAAGYFRLLSHAPDALSMTLATSPMGA